jgi:predicted HTH domain antitoxin
MIGTAHIEPPLPYIEYPSNLPDALHQAPAEFEREARLGMAVKLFEMKRLTSGPAALLAGIDRTTFLMRLAENGVATLLGGYQLAVSGDGHPAATVSLVSGNVQADVRCLPLRE